MLLVSRQLRVGLFELDGLQARLRSSRKELNISRKAQADAALELKQAQQERARARLDLSGAQAKADELRKALVPLQTQREKLCLLYTSDAADE